MKKLVIALTAIAAFTAPALAADMAAKAPVRAAPVAYAPSWTGCYVGGGLGYGWYNTESTEVSPVTGVFVANQGDGGGKGWMGQVGGGCDYQFSGPMGSWVVGVLADYTFSNVKGQHVGAPITSWISDLKQDSAWAVGGRIGYLVSPTFLTYFNAGYTETHFQGTTAVGFISGLPATPAFGLQSATYKGWFLGSGFEYGFNFLPGLYLKTEYRFSEFDRRQVNVVNTAGAIVTAESIKPFSQSVISSLVYRFNWGGPVVAKY